MRHTLKKNIRIIVDKSYGLKRNRVTKIIKSEAYIAENTGLKK